MFGCNHSKDKNRSRSRYLELIQPTPIKIFPLLIEIRDVAASHTHQGHRAILAEYEKELNATLGLLDMKQPDMPSKELLKILDKTHRKWQMGKLQFSLVQ